MPKLTYEEPTKPAGLIHPGAEQAVAFVRAQLGVPYVWGGDGPEEGGFDCSGLSTKAWAAAGLSIPRQSQLQWNATDRVARADLQPGDLVFFGSPIHHLGVYIGNDKMIEAPKPGMFVRIASINRRDLAGGGRIRWQ